MSSFPGETPQPTGANDEDPSDATDPTQPVGYWERQADERAQQNPSDPTSAYPQDPYPTNQGGTPHPTPYPSPSQGPYYGQGGAGYPPQSGPAGGPPPYNPSGQAGVPGPAAYGFTPAAPPHPQATLSLVLGLVGLVGAFFTCGLTLVVSPFAWAVGRRSVREIEASQGQLSGDSQARTGMITGIVGTVLLVLAIIAIIGFIVLVLGAGAYTSGSSI